MGFKNWCAVINKLFILRSLSFPLGAKIRDFLLKVLGEKMFIIFN